MKIRKNAVKITTIVPLAAWICTGAAVADQACQLDLVGSGPTSSAPSNAE